MIVVTGLRASRVNLLQNDFAAGLPSPFAFLGLLAAIAPNLGVPRWQMGVLPVIHSLTSSPGRTKGAQSKHANGFRMSGEIVEDMRGTVAFSLVVDPGAPIDEDELLDHLRNARLAGGLIQAAPGRASRAELVTADGSLFRRMPRGRVILPMDGKPTARGRGDDLAVFADALYPVDRSAEPGWRVPVAVGHALLDNPATVEPRRGVRDTSIPHVFAEPMVGIAELMSPRNSRLTSMTSESLRALMWRYNTAPAAGDHQGLITAHHFYL